MTNEQASEALKQLRHNFATNGEIYFALTMAIKSLSAEQAKIEIGGEIYVAENPKIKTIAKDGEVCISGFKKDNEA